MAMRSGATCARVDKRVRMKAVTDRALHSIKRAMDANGISSVASLTETTPRAPSLRVGRRKGTVSVSTRRHAVRVMRVHARVAAKKPILSANNLANRLEWVTERRGWTAKCASALFTHESSFVVGDARSSRIWHRSGERSCPRRLRPTFEAGRQSVMTWGAFEALGPTPLTRVEGSMNATKYSGVLEDYLVHQSFADFDAPDAAGRMEYWAPFHAPRHPRT